MTSVVENLKAAKALIDTPEKWAQGPEREPCLCAIDAVSAVGGVWEVDLSDALERALPEGFEEDHSDWNHPVAQYNDLPTTTHADIMALFDRAIAAEEAKEAAA